MPQLVIIRHGQSEWNKENRFTGWVDVDLSEKGVEEAHHAASLLKDYKFDQAFTSNLKRANRTLEIILNDLNQTEVPVEHSEKLNERMYGQLQGKNKDEMREAYGDEQVHIWRRSYDVAPPDGESLKDTAERVLPYFESAIVPALRAGKRVIVSAHGNSLRALMMKLENIDPKDITSVEIPTGVPKVYDLNENIQVKSAKFLK